MREGTKIFMEKIKNLPTWSIPEQERLSELNGELFGEDLFVEITPEVESNPDYTEYKSLVSKKQAYYKFMHS